jgi:hypothetical protein
LALLGAGNRDVMLGIVRASFCGRHSAAPAAIERNVELQRLGLQCPFPELIEDMM